MKTFLEKVDNPYFWMGVQGACMFFIITSFMTGDLTIKSTLIFGTMYILLMGFSRMAIEKSGNSKETNAAKVEKYKKALEFYANKENYEAWDEYEDATGYFNNVDFDEGDRARTALEEEENEE